MDGIQDLKLAGTSRCLLCKVPEASSRNAHRFGFACSSDMRLHQQCSLKRVAITKLEKRLLLLTTSIDGTLSPDEPYTDLVAEDDDVYHVVRGGFSHIDLDPQAAWKHGRRHVGTCSCGRDGVCVGKDFRQDRRRHLAEGRRHSRPPRPAVLVQDKGREIRSPLYWQD